MAPTGAIILMYNLSNIAWVFGMYLAMFYGLLFYSRYRLKLSRGLSFAVAVYIPFAISVLWELPVQLAIPQNPVALAMSSLKALAIPFFFIMLYRQKWRVRTLHIATLSIVLLIGILLYGLISIEFVTRPIINEVLQFTPSTWIAIHSYRLPWLIFFFTTLETLYRKKVT